MSKKKVLKKSMKAGDKEKSLKKLKTVVKANVNRENTVEPTKVIHHYCYLVERFQLFLKY